MIKAAPTLAAFSLLGLALPAPLVAQDIDYGDDTSQFAMDGECDDSRFEGSGMTDTILLESDVGHDATDCRVAVEQDRLRLKGNEPSPVIAAGIDVPMDAIDFGNDEGDYAKDGECDDARFVGSGMSSDLVVDSIGKDATDCRAAFSAETVQLNAFFSAPSDDNPIDFGNDSGEYANDDECDDIRFTGEYSSSVVYLVQDIGHDATDCKAVIDSGEATWQGATATPNYGQMD